MIPSQKTWFQTYTGKAFDFADPRPEDICLEDIARALSHQCRFNGHCRTFYSVAEHSVHVAYRVDQILDQERWAALPDSIRLAARKRALLHDALEAYTGDVVRPLRPLMSNEFDLMEAELLSVIARKYNISPAPLLVPEDDPVRRADNELLATEKIQILAEPPREWLPLPSPLAIKLDCWGPERAYSAFMAEAADRGIQD